MPFGSEAQKFDGGMPGARRPASGLAFQGICQAPTLTSGTSVAIGVRIAPGPTEAGGKAGGVALIGLRSDEGGQLLDRVDDAEVEGLALGMPGRVDRWRDAEHAVDPLEECLRA